MPPVIAAGESNIMPLPLSHLYHHSKHSQVGSWQQHALVKNKGIWQYYQMIDFKYACGCI